MLSALGWGQSINRSNSERLGKFANLYQQMLGVVKIGVFS